MNNFVIWMSAKLSAVSLLYCHISTSVDVTLPFPLRLVISPKAQQLDNLDKLRKGSVDRRTDRLDVFPELNRLDSALGDALRGKLKFLGCMLV
jgi:hypothetical protein